MPSIADMEELAKQVQRELNDPEGNRYSLEVIYDLFDEGQFEYVKKTKCLIAIAAIINKENQSVYNYPEDFLEPLLFENKDRGPITSVDHHFLLRQYGRTFRKDTTTGNPKYTYSSLSGKGKFELYPRPNPSAEKAPLTTSAFTLSKTSRVFDNLAGMTSKEGKLYVVDDPGIVILDEQLNRARTISFSDTPLTALCNISIVRAKPDFDFIVTQNTKIYKFDNAEVESLFHTEAVSISFLSGIEEAQYGFVYGSTTEIRARDFDNTQSTILASFPMTQGVFDIASNKHLIATRSNGLWSYEDASGWAQNQETTTKCDGVCILSKGSPTNNPISKIYVNLNGTLNKFDPSTSTFTATTITTLLVSSILLPINSEKLYALNTSRNLIRINVTTETIEETWGDFVTNDSFIRTKDWAVADSFAYLLDIQDRVDTGVTELYQSDPEYGAVVYIDDFIFGSEEGALVDIKDDTDTVEFSQEEGVVRSLVTNTEALYLTYVREPRPRVIEIPEPRALKEWAKYKLKENQGDAKSTRQSRVYLANFMDLVDQGQGDLAYGFNQNQLGSTPNFLGV